MLFLRQVVVNYASKLLLQVTANFLYYIESPLQPAAHKLYSVETLLQYAGGKKYYIESLLQYAANNLQYIASLLQSAAVSQPAVPWKPAHAGVNNIKIS